MNNNELKHYGIQGMHWGNRHTYYKGTSNPHYMRKVAKQEHKIEKIYNKATKLTNKINKKRHDSLFNRQTPSKDKELNERIFKAYNLSQKMQKQLARKNKKLSPAEKNHIIALHSKASVYIDSLSQVKTDDLVVRLNALAKTKATQKNIAIQKTYEKLRGD